MKLSALPRRSLRLCGGLDNRRSTNQNERQQITGKTQRTARKRRKISLGYLNCPRQRGFVVALLREREHNLISCHSSYRIECDLFTFTVREIGHVCCDG